jgi:hypothetical protein
MRPTVQVISFALVPFREVEQFTAGIGETAFLRNYFAELCSRRAAARQKRKDYQQFRIEIAGEAAKGQRLKFRRFRPEIAFFRFCYHP